MTVDEIKAQVARIRARAGDDEMAHMAEDELHQSVLHAIASGECDDAKASAAAALETLEIEFARWCA